MNYKAKFEEIVNHAKKKNFLLDYGGDQASISIFAFKNVLEYLGINQTPKINSLVQLSALPEKEFLEKYKIGIRWLYPKPSKKTEILLEKYKDTINIDVESEIKKGYISDGSGKHFIDEWGVKWARSAFYFEMVDHPLKGKSFNEIKKYKFPDPQDKNRTNNLKNEVNLYLKENPNFVLSLSQSYGGILETAFWLRGFMDFYIDLASNTKECSYILDSLKDYFIEWNRNYINAVDAKIDIVAIGDDYGMQDRTIISPDLWRHQIKPRYADLIEDAKTLNNNIKWFHHSCGSIFPIINDLIDIGVDILNPIQPFAVGMQPEKLKKEFGSRITFHGGIDIQKLLPFSNPDEIKSEVKRVINILCENGGYIVAPSHNIQALTPVNNIIAFYNTVAEIFSEINK